MTADDRAIFKDRLNNLAVLVEMLQDDPDMPYFLKLTQQLVTYSESAKDSPQAAIIIALQELIGDPRTQ